MWDPFACLRRRGSVFVALVKTWSIIVAMLAITKVSL